MLDKKPSEPPVEPGLRSEADDTAQEAEYFEPRGAPQPLTGKGPAPRVKRFNRKTVAILSVTALAVVVLAFGTSLSRRPPVKNNQEAAAQKTAANTTTSDAINGLPSDYSQVKRAPVLGAPIPGDMGAIAQASGMVSPAAAVPNGATAVAGPPRQLTPLEQYEQQQALERVKRSDQARDGGFSFAGGSRGAAGGSGGGVNGENSDVMSRLLAEQQALQGATKPAASDGLMQVSDRSSSTRDDDNRQDDKSHFVNGQRHNQWLLKEVQESAPSPFTLFSSTIIPGVLITGINSDLPGQIKGQVSQNVYDTVTGKHLLIPQGTVLVGQYDSRVTYGQSRVLVVWTRIIRPDGTNIDLEGMPGTDLSGYAGITGDVDRHIWRLLGAVVLGSFIQAGVQSGTNVGYGPQSFSDSARQGIGSGVSDATQQLTRKELQIQPTITVAPGERFNVFLTKDVVLTPYKS